MDLLIWTVIGVGVGLLAQYVLRDQWSGGMAGNLILGVIGAVVAGWLLRAILSGAVSGISLWGLLTCLVGASAMLWAGRAFTATPRLR